jgi:hypothetical protein
MGSGIRLAIAILIFFVAFVCFFFAFHPGGVQGVSDPNTMLQWLMGEFQNTSSGNTVSPDDISNLETTPPSSTAGQTTIPGVNEPTGIPGASTTNPYNSPQTYGI